MIDQLISELVAYGLENGLIDDTKIMGILTPAPSVVRKISDIPKGSN